MQNNFDLPPKAVSIGQPWSTLLAIGVLDKLVIRQSYSYRGLIAIHANTMTCTDDEDKMCKQTDIAKALTKAGHRGFLDEHGAGVHLLAKASIVGIAELIDIKWEKGREYTWVFKNPRQLPKPIPARGAFGIFDTQRAISTAPQKKPTQRRFKKR